MNNAHNGKKNRCVTLTNLFLSMLHWRPSAPDGGYTCDSKPPWAAQRTGMEGSTAVNMMLAKKHVAIVVQSINGIKHVELY